MSPLAVFGIVTVLCTLVSGGAKVKSGAPADIESEKSLRVLKEKLKGYVDSATNTEQLKCILQRAGKTIIKAKTVKLGVKAAKTSEEIEDLKDRVKNMTPEEKNRVKAKATVWLKKEEEAMDKCLTL